MQFRNHEDLKFVIHNVKFTCDHFKNDYNTSFFKNN